MRWYVNDSSLQGQYDDATEFRALLEGLLVARQRHSTLGQSLYLTRSFPDRHLRNNLSVREYLRQAELRDLRGLVLSWFDRKGPFVDDERLAEEHDYFECLSIDVTDTGLGEAARRIKAKQLATTFSFSRGEIDFCRTPLVVDQGLSEDRLGSYDVANIWTLNAVETEASALRAKPTNWEELGTFVRELFEHLVIPDFVFRDGRLAAEPFDSVILDQTVRLLTYLNTYMHHRNSGGSEDAGAKAIIAQFFNGDRALFSGESQTNQQDFESALTFLDPDDPERRIFAHWHGKISHRFFRLHFEWPLPAEATHLKILYLGPKLTKR